MDTWIAATAPNDQATICQLHSRVLAQIVAANIGLRRVLLTERAAIGALISG